MNKGTEHSNANVLMLISMHESRNIKGLKKIKCFKYYTNIEASVQFLF